MPSGLQKKRFVKCLQQGELVAYPTEAVFGLGCDPLNANAVYRLLALKNRPQHKGLILIASHIDQLRPYIKPLPKEIVSRVTAEVDVPTTWLLPAHESVPTWLRGDNKTVAIRVVQHDLASELCSLADMAIVSTSANLSGMSPLKEAYKARIKFHQWGVHTINGCVGNALEPSRIIDPFSNKRYR